jgi:hypothetical protein
MTHALSFRCAARNLILLIGYFKIPHPRHVGIRNDIEYRNTQYPYLCLILRIFIIISGVVGLYFIDKVTGFVIGIHVENYGPFNVR